MAKLSPRQLENLNAVKRYTDKGEDAINAGLSEAELASLERHGVVTLTWVPRRENEYSRSRGWHSVSWNDATDIALTPKGYDALTK